MSAGVWPEASTHSRKDGEIWSVSRGSKLRVPRVRSQHVEARVTIKERSRNTPAQVE
jgi:hypothetical protein